MKLKTEFIKRKIGSNYVAVTAEGGKDVLNGLVRNNATADFIFEQLREKTTEEEIVRALCEEYNVPEERVAEDVHRTLTVWKNEGLLDE